MTIESRIVNNKKQYRYRIYYSDPLGKRKQKNSKWYKTRKKALQEEALFKLKTTEEKTFLPFSAVAEDWIRFTSINNASNTTKDKRSIVEKYYKPFLDKNIYKISSGDCKTLLEGPNVAALSTSRKNNIYSFLKSIFSHAQKFFELSSNPMDPIPRFQKTSEERLKEMNIYTPADFKRFYEAIPDQQKEIADFFYILYWTGMRKNELRSLTFGDFNGRSLRIWRQWKDNKFEPLKTKGSVRSIAIDKKCIDIINNQHDYYMTFPEFSSSWFIFGGYKPIPKTNIDRCKQQTIKNNHLPEIRIHDFRHSHASYLISKGVNMYKISKRLGHSSITMTMDRYGHLMPKDEDEILNAINDNF